MPFKSLQPDIYPPNVTIWDFLFNPTSPHSPLRRAQRTGGLGGGYLNAATGEQVSWPAVRTNATYIHTALSRHHGLVAGDTVALFSANTIWYPVVMFAVLRAGGRVSGASPAYGVEEMEYALRVSKAKYLFTGPGSIEVGLKAAEKVGIPRSRVFLLEGEVGGFETVSRLIERGRECELDQELEYKMPPGMRNGDLCGFLSFSSGTTGLPKAVMIAHGNVISQCLQIQQISPPDLDRVLAVLPLFHITGLVHGMHLPALLNATVVMLPAFTMEGMLSTIVKYKLPELLLVPPILIRMVRDPIVKTYDLSHVRRFSSGAAPLSPEILTALQQQFPGTGFKQGYGMTESCSCITAHPPHLYDYKHATAVGTIVASTEVRILKDDGTDGGINEPGEILARGPQVVMGYLDNAEATANTFDEDGWLHTGDQGRIDEDGLVHILDRIKEMIKVKGIGVAPAELEDLLLGHEKVEDCAVLGIPDEWAGERPKAFVVLKGGKKGDESTGKALLQFVKEKKVRDKWVLEVEFIDEIPKSASGKILRRMLRDRKPEEKGTLVRDEKKREAKL